MSSSPAPSTAATPRGIPGSSSALKSGPAHDELILQNQLSKSRSPYVRAHATNPVAWQLWCPETLALAKRHNRIIFVSIGYAACHWCHVMERESFENDEIARVLNENFIPIKVDREERPDIDRIYMNFVQATSGSGGWPLNVFLTPDLEPVFGGTYWPGPRASAPMKDQIGFLEVLEKIVQTWKEQRAKFLQSAKEILPRLREFADEGLKGTEGDDETLDVDLLEEAYQQFVARYDPQHGGFGFPPKFPLPMKLAFLLRLGTFPRTVKDVVGECECENAVSMVMFTLNAMADGGIHDQIGHGFARYSVTADWSLPHFEKMLYDNAQLLGVYLDAWMVTKDQKMLDTAIRIANYLCDDALANKDGGFFSSEGADSLYRKGDSDKREGAFYVWTRHEFETLLGAQEAAICAKYWNVHRDGNVDPMDDAHDEFHNQNVLSVATTVEKLGETHNLPTEKISQIIADARKKLKAHRDSERPRPNLDDKIITAWNGLAITSLARASNVLRVTHVALADKFKDAAIRTAAFIRKNLYDANTHTLKRVFREEPGDTPGFADDYAFFTSSLIHLYEATFDASYLRWADDLQKKQIELFWDSKNGGFFSTREDANDIILRLKDGLDSQEPSINGVSASNLFRLSTILGDDSYATYAHKTCLAFSPEILEHPALFPTMMAPIVACTLGMRSVVLSGRFNAAEIQEQVRKVRERLWTNTTLVMLDEDDQTEDAKWLRERNPLYKDFKGKEKKVQICEGTKCLDAFDFGELENALEELG